MWTSKAFEYRGTEGHKLTIKERNEGVLLTAKDGVFFESEDEFLEFCDEMKEKASAFFEEI